MLQDHARGQVLGLLRGAALNLLRGRCALWSETAPLTARAEWPNGRRLTVLATLAARSRFRSAQVADEPVESLPPSCHECRSPIR